MTELINDWKVCPMMTQRFLMMVTMNNIVDMIHVIAQIDGGGFKFVDDLGMSTIYFKKSTLGVLDN